MDQAVPGTELRVESHSPEIINDQISRDIEARICYFAERLDQIETRLNELEYEWDIERTLETNAAAFSVAGMVLGLAVNRKWLGLPVIVGGFLLQHAIQGWCPPVAWFRRMGIRTTREINREKYALKALRGDFDNVNSKTDETLDSKVRKVVMATAA